MEKVDFKYVESDALERRERNYNMDRCDYENKHKKDIVLACGQVCDDHIPILDADNKCQVASLDLDLRNMKNPLVKLDFSSVIKFRDLDEGIFGPISAANASFTLKLYRLSSCCKKICIGSWEFKRYYNDIAIGEVGLFLAATKDSFCFTKCDHPVCDDCVTYFLEVYDTTYEENFLTRLYMTQINFNAIAVSQC